MPKDIGNLISEIKKGSQQAFRILVEQHQQYAFNLAFRILYNDEDAKDTVQDSFIKIWKNIHQYNPKIKFTTWMYKIVTNTAIDKLRESSRRSFIDLDLATKSLHLITSDSPDKTIENNDLGRSIQLVTEQLPEKQKMVFTLRDIQGLKSFEVQEILDLSENSVKSNLYIARQFLRKKLTEILNYERVQR